MPVNKKQIKRFSLQNKLNGVVSSVRAQELSRKMLEYLNIIYYFKDGQMDHFKTLKDSQENSLMASE